MKFAFLVHPLTDETRQLVGLNKTGRFVETWGKDLFTFLDGLNKGINSVQDFCARVPTDRPWVVDYLPSIKSLTGQEAEGRIYEIPMLPHEILLDSSRALSIMEAAVDEAADWGAKIVGLGSMTGIVGGRGAHLRDYSSVPVTTGNSLTVFAALEGLNHACEEAGLDLANENVAVVGVPGSIATAAAKILKPQCKNVLLVGRSESARSRRIAKEVDAEFTCDIQDALRRSRIVFTATSSGDCIDQKWLSSSSIVIDVAVPTDVIGSKSIRDDILVLSGGLSRIPAGNRIDSSYFFFQRGMIPSCLGETIVLSLEGRAESYSIGQDLSTEKILGIGRRAKRNGFNFTKLCSFGAAIDETVITKFRKLCRPQSYFFQFGMESQAVKNGDETGGTHLAGDWPENKNSELNHGNGKQQNVASFVTRNGNGMHSMSSPLAFENGDPSQGGPPVNGLVNEFSVELEGSMIQDFESSNGRHESEPFLIDKNSAVTNGAKEKQHVSHGAHVANSNTKPAPLMNNLAKRAQTLFRRHLNSVLGGLGEKVVKTFVRGQGCYVWDDRGNRYLDFVAGFGSLNLGHNHPLVCRALQTALAEEAPGFVQAAVNPLTAALAEKLVTLAPSGLDTVFFTNSGTESVEAALKVTRLSSNRTGFLHCRNSYHGKTLGSLSVTGNWTYQRPFEPLLDQCEAVDFGDLESLALQLKTKKYAAFIVEPIQAEGGMIVPPDDYFKQVQKLCRETGTLLIADEVQTGLGRTGNMFASEFYNLEPDVMTLAKSLSGGLVPAGAMLVRGEIWRKAYGALDSFALHTSTFGGGSLASAVGLATLEVLQNEKLDDYAWEMGQRLKSGLQELCQRVPILKEVRGEGLLLGLECNPMNESVVAHWKDSDESLLSTALGAKLDDVLKNISSMYVMHTLLHQHQIYTQTARSNPLVLRIQPPLTINEEQIDYFLEALEKCASEISYSTQLVDGLFAKTGVGNSAERPVESVTPEA